MTVGTGGRGFMVWRSSMINLVIKGAEKPDLMIRLLLL